MATDRQKLIWNMCRWRDANRRPGLVGWAVNTACGVELGDRPRFWMFFVIPVLILGGVEPWE